MSLKTVATAAVVALGLAAANIAAFATPAEARDHGWNRHHGKHRPDAAYGYGHPVPAPYHQKRRDRTGDAVGAAILGIGALIVGAAIADAARSKRHYHYED